MVKIEKNTLQFLENLAANNNRDWFQENKNHYEVARNNVKALVAEIFAELQKTDQLEGAKAFRIYRDIRFSKDKTPYKKNFGASFKRATAMRRGGYYLHIQPNASFVGGGFWKPNSKDLKRIRKEIEFDATPFRKIIADKTFQQYFGELEGDEVKTAPRGFSIDHPAIDLLRKKQFLIRRFFTDKEVQSSDFQSEVINTFIAMRPFFDYMSEVLTTNMNGERIV